MKTNDLFMMAAAALGVFLIARQLQGGASSAPVVGANFNPATTAADAGFGNLIATWQGWRYYDSGYGKDAAGNIYYQGQRVS